MNNSIFIISFYNSRTPKLLEGLINDLIHFNQTIAVIANIDDFNKVEMEKHNDIYFLKRPNIMETIHPGCAGIPRLRFAKTEPR